MSVCLSVPLLRYVPSGEPIDLINVAFGQKSLGSQMMNKKKRKAVKNDCSKISSQEGKLSYDVPDRRTGRNGLKELSRLNNTREWRFVEVRYNLPCSIYGIS